MGALEALDPMSQDWLDKLEHIRGAVARHMYEEEGNWFVEPDENTDETARQQIGQRDTEEFEHYARGAKAARTGVATFTRSFGGGVEGFSIGAA